MVSSHMTSCDESMLLVYNLKVFSLTCILLDAEFLDQMWHVLQSYSKLSSVISSFSPILLETAALPVTPVVNTLLH